MHTLNEMDTRPSSLRIGVGSTVLAAHLLVLLLMTLARPMALDEMPVVRATPPIRVEIRPPDQVVSIPPPPMPTAPQRPTVRQDVVPVPVVPVLESEAVDVSPVALLEPADLPAASPDAIGDTSEDALGGSGVAGLALLYGPEPPYPSRAKRMGWQGEVRLRIHIGTNGLPMEVEVLRSSGHAELDRAARSHVQRYWRFAPPGQVVFAELPIRFALY